MDFIAPSRLGERICEWRMANSESSQFTIRIHHSQIHHLPTMLMLVTYDIPNDRRRAKIAKTLLDYGDRVQYSVFECNLTSKQISQLQKELKELVDKEKDSVRVYKLCAECAANIKTMGSAQPPSDVPIVYIV